MVDSQHSPNESPLAPVSSIAQASPWKGLLTPGPTPNLKRDLPEPAPTPVDGAKRIKIFSPGSGSRHSREPREGPVLNQPPIEVLDVYAFDRLVDGDLGAGPEHLDNGFAARHKDEDISRLRPQQVAFGRAHTILLSETGIVLTWGSNDYGALGRITRDGAVERDRGIAPHDLETVPTELSPDNFHSYSTVVAVAATEYASYVLTADGQVFGWGTHRANDGILGFSPGVQVQQTPVHLSSLSKITQLAAGANHMLALDAAGNVHAWGAGQAGQLGRRLTERRLAGGLRPARCLTGKRVVHIAAGARHSFAVTATGAVYAWGLNDFGQCGLPRGPAPEVTAPTLAPGLTAARIHTLAGGPHHSLGITADGELRAWGRCDNAQLGVDPDILPDADVARDHRGAARAVTAPALVPGVRGALCVAAGDDTGFVVDGEGNVWAWGAGEGFGHTRDIEIARVVYTGGRKMTWVGPNGAFGAATSLRSSEDSDRAMRDAI